MSAIDYVAQVDRNLSLPPLFTALPPARALSLSLRWEVDGCRTQKQ